MNADNELPSPLVDVNGAARLLCTTPRHIKSLLATRVLPRVHIGGKTRIRVADIHAIINGPSDAPT